MRGNRAGLGDLKRLHRQALARRQQQEEAAARQAAKRDSPTMGQARRPADPRHDAAEDNAALEQAMRHVRPIAAATRAAHPPRAVDTAQSAHRRAAALGETVGRADTGVSDGGDVTHLLSEGGTAYVRGDAAPDTARRLRRGLWRTGAEIDLHGLRVEQARHAVLSFLDECLERDIRCLRIVHGKGHGSQDLTPVLKDKVRTWLVQKNQVIAFSEAPEREGGAGALLVLLRHADEPRL